MVMLYIILIYLRYVNLCQKWPRMETKNSFFNHKPFGLIEDLDKKYS